MKQMSVFLKLVLYISVVLSSLPAQVGVAEGLIEFEEHVISDYIPNSIAVYSGDLDSDGDIDVLGSDRQNYKFYLFENDGEQNFTTHVIDNIDAYYIDAGDIDQDGDVDIAVVGFEIYHYEAHWYENVGNLAFVRHKLAHYDVDPSYVKIIDFDLDGDRDLITNANGWNWGHVYWYENDGNQNFTQHTILNLYSPNDNGCRTSVPVDLDLDGDLDIVHPCDSSPIFWYENDGSQNFTQHDISRILRLSYNVWPVDMDNDGDIDVLCSDWFDGTFWLENDGNQNFTEHRISSNRQYITHLWADDVDQDGDMDVVEPASWPHQVSLWINDGSMSFTEVIVADDIGGVIGISVVDMDQDGDDDIIIDDFGNHTISWYEYKTTNQPPVADAGPDQTSDEGTTVILDGGDSYDVDGDSLIFHWEIVTSTGPEITLSSNDSMTTSFGTTDNGSYTLLLAVSDGQGFTATDEVLITINNVAPFVEPITAPINPSLVNTDINATVNFTDPGITDIHTAIWDWGDNTTSAGVVMESIGSGSVSGNHVYTQPGVYTLKVTMVDNDGGWGESVFRYVVIYDPSMGFVTGGGWINSPEGAYLVDPTLTGKAKFGFVAKYQKGANVPEGQTEFQFKIANLHFHSTSYDWLVIAGSKAQIKGTGTINGTGEYGFMLTATDGIPDKFRIKIWEKMTGTIIYDNMLDAAEDANPSTILGGGSIVIHK